MSVDILLVLVADVLLGGLFLFGGIGKLKGLAAFTETLGNYRLLPGVLVRPAAVLIAAGELAVGAATLAGLPLGDQSGMLGVAALLLVYAAAMSINIARGHDSIDCGCLGFGAARASLGWDMVMRNVALAAIAVMVFALPAEARALRAIDWISGMGAIAAFALFYYGFGQFSAMRLRGKAMVK